MFAPFLCLSKTVLSFLPISVVVFERSLWAAQLWMACCFPWGDTLIKWEKITVQSDSEVNRFLVPFICSRFSYPLAPLNLTFWALDFTMVMHAGHLFCLRHCANCLDRLSEGRRRYLWRRVEPPDCAHICVSSVWQLHMTWVCQWLQNLLPSMLRHM